MITSMIICYMIVYKMIYIYVCWNFLCKFLCISNILTVICSKLFILRNIFADFVYNYL